MTDIRPDDLRAAVDAGRISEAQAASLITLAEQRAGVRTSADPTEEPFELFRGFNEVFIVTGLAILAFGWIGVVGLAFIDSMTGPTFLGASLGSLAVLYGVSHYFIRKRRMVGPAFLLSGLAVFGAFCLALSLAMTLFESVLDTEPTEQLLLLFVMGTAVSVVGFFWYQFRVPILLGALALSAYTIILILLSPGWDVFTYPGGIFLLTGTRYVGTVTLITGLAVFIAAMWFDLKDRHRVTRHAANAFWLHAVAALLIISPVGTSLLLTGDTLSISLLLGFIAAMAFIAVIVDRRSFLMASIIYVVSVSTRVGDTETIAVLITILGLALTLLGAKWTDLRALLMRLPPLRPIAHHLPPTKDTP
ncbi:MAG: hypothetical protein AAGJ96_10900 [Pseudomonadota bacterium]